MHDENSLFAPAGPDGVELSHACVGLVATDHDGTALVGEHCAPFPADLSVPPQTRLPGPESKLLAPVALPEQRSRIATLDGLRGIAIIAVMAFHFLPYNHVAGIANPLIRYGLRAVHFGQTGVDLFFVLSGFLITGILLDTKQDARYFWKFYARRTLRIAPLYYGVVLLVVPLPLLIASRSLGDAMQQLRSVSWLWLHLTNVGQFLGHDVPAGHFWSLAVEEHFYLVWPMVVYWSTRKWLVRICLFTVAVAMVTRCALSCYGYVPFSLTPCRMDALALGGLLAIVATREGGLKPLVPQMKWGMAGLSVVLGAVYLSKQVLGTPLVQAVAPTLIAALFSCSLVIAVCAIPGTLTARCLSAPLLTMFGTYSYGLYVFHGLLCDHFQRWFPIANTSSAAPFLVQATIRLAGSVAISLLLAWLSWHLYEKQFLKLKRRVSYQSCPH